MIQNQHISNRYIPRPPTLDSLMGLSYCIQDFPAYDLPLLKVMIDQTNGAQMYPSSDFPYHTRTYTHEEPRWHSDFDAVDWAYSVLGGQIFEHLAMHRLYQPSKQEQLDTSLLVRQSKHQYDEKGQNRQLTMSSTTPVPQSPHIISDRLLAEEMTYLLGPLQEMSGHASWHFMWHGSFLEFLYARKPHHLQQLLTSIGTSNSNFFAYSSGRSTIFAQLAAHLLDKDVPPTVNDADLFALFLPWGSRSTLFFVDAFDGDETLRIGVCYLRPYQEAPPIRIEIPAHMMTEDRWQLLDKAMAHFILNPDTVY